MPAIVPIIVAGVAAGSTYASSRSSSNANRDAARIEAGSTDKALAAQIEQDRLEREHQAYLDQQNEAMNLREWEQTSYLNRQGEERTGYDRRMEQEQIARDAGDRDYRRGLDAQYLERDQQRYDTNTRNYADFRGLMEPYLRQGTTPSAQISSLMAGRGPSAPMAQSAQQPQGGAVVMLEAPNGQRKAVPQAQAQHYIAQGAKQVS